MSGPCYLETTVYMHRHTFSLPKSWKAGTCLTQRKRYRLAPREKERRRKTQSSKLNGFGFCNTFKVELTRRKMPQPQSQRMRMTLALMASSVDVVLQTTLSYVIPRFRLFVPELCALTYVSISSLTQDQMIQCPDAHLFCNSCMITYASGLLGEHNPNIVCMDQTGCKLAFPVSELRRFLTPKLLELYDRVKQTKEIEAAGLENLEHCPFCEYKVVIDNPDEKLFRCENLECGAVSCRGCKKLVGSVFV
jgi:hypothetical protein